jgi:hypothetical protein
LALDTERIGRVAQRIVRGLFFHEKRHPVPRHYEVLGYLQPAGIDSTLELFNNERIIFPALRTVQDGIFAYTFRASEQDPDSTILLALFYRQLHLVGCTRLPTELRGPETVIASGNGAPYASAGR